MSSSLIFVLHAHLPYVRQSSAQSTIEELWFIEAMWETYLPLLDLLQKNSQRHSGPAMAISISPPLAEMMRDPLMNEKFRSHMKALETLAASEVKRTKGTDHETTALLYIEKIKAAIKIYKKCGGDVIAAFSQLFDSGVVEMLATSATHAFLPAYESVPEAVRFQVRAGIEYYERLFGRRPKGFWLPECGYYEGLDLILRDEAIEYFFVEAHGLINGSPLPGFSVHKPVITPSGIAAFGRDTKSCSQVWSAESGYPGAASYRDFYRDIGFDLSADYLSGFFHDFGARVFTGFKYHAVARSLTGKASYNRSQAAEQAYDHAIHFIAERTIDFAELSEYCDAPVIVAAFDAELFGHWWFEGIEWLSGVIEVAAKKRPGFKLNTPSAYLLECGDSLQKSCPSASSWGEGGYNACWISSGSSEFYRHLLEQPVMLKQMLYESYNRRCRITQSAVMQAVREMLLAQSSDWLFLMQKNRARAYAEKRLADHIKNFLSIFDQVMQNRIDDAMLSELERQSPYPAGYCLQDFRSIKCFS